jgi:hypothetical protein
MRKYTTNTVDTCWRDCLGCILEIDPRRVPNFLKLYGNDYVLKTYEWLRRKHRKGMVYIPTKNFMETCEPKFNVSVGPKGYSIGYLTMIDSSTAHVVICYDGAVVWDNGDERHEEYDILAGYFIIYDLE